MGTLDEVKVLAEIGNGNGGVSGTVEFPYAKVYLDSGTSNQSQGQTPIQNQTPAQSQTSTQNETPVQNQAPAQGQTSTQNETSVQNQTQPQNNWDNIGNNNGGLGIPQGQNPAQGQNQASPQSNSTPNSNCAGEWAQCGGQGFNGPTCCSKGTCVEINQYYSQCKP